MLTRIHLFFIAVGGLLAGWLLATEFIQVDGVGEYSKGTHGRSAVQTIKDPVGASRSTRAGQVNYLTDKANEAGYVGLPTGPGLANGGQPLLACSITLKTTTSGCYQNNGSKATVSVEVAWNEATVSTAANNTTDVITVTLGSQTATVNPGPYTTTGGSGTIVSPQVVAFEIPANGAVGTVSAVFANNAACTGTASYTAPAACPPTPCLSGQSGGTVFNDYNADGVQSTGEITGLSSVTVTAYNCVGTLVGTATTDAFGKYAFTGLTAASYPIRVEFSGLPTLYGQGTMYGSSSRSTVRFISSADCNVNLGVLNPNDYCQSQPRIFLPCFVYGNPLVAGTTAATGDAFVGINYGASGYKDNSQMQLLANGAAVGSLWGTAYNKYTKKLYSSALMRRFMGLGPLGLGGIYQTDVTTNVTTGFLSVTAVGVNVGQSLILANSARDLPSAREQPGRDPQGWTYTGKVGLGDLEVSEDGQYLFFINLFDRKLYRLAIDSDGNTATAPTAADVTAYTIPDPGCTGGESRPFALKIDAGTVYVGTVCDASLSNNKADLRATVYSFTPSSNTWNTVFAFPLTYPKGHTTNDFQQIRNGWFPWTQNHDGTAYLDTGWGGYNITYPAPLLSDIEFDPDGSMILGFSDRTAMQTGYYNYAPTGTSTAMYFSIPGGDILRAARLGNTYVLENNARVGSTTGYGPGNFQGLGFGEFYNDNWQNYHQEVTLGGLALRPGSGEVITTAYDPVDLNSQSDLATGGIRHLSNTTGLTTRSFQVYIQNTPATFGKGAGLGDPEVGCDLPAYVEIGNRVWVDQNRDGLQDACEPALPGVNVGLYSNNILIANTTTNSNGEYYFNNVVSSTAVAGVASTASLLPNTAYQIAFGIGGQYVGGVLSTTAARYSLTQANSSAATNGDLIDSDAQPASVGGSIAPAISVTTGAVGSVNHSVDAGFTNLPDLQITKTATSATVVQGSTNTYRVMVTNAGGPGGTASNVVVTDVLGAGQTLTSSVPLPTTTNSNTLTYSLGTLTAGSSSTLTLTVSATTGGVMTNLVSVTGSEPESSTVANNTARANFSVPIVLCTGQSYVATLPGSFVGVQWYRAGTLVGSGNSLTITQAGSYSYTTTSNSCPTGGCAPFIVNSGTAQSLTLSASPSTICQGSSTTLTLAGCSNGNLLWSNGQTAASIVVSPTSTTAFSVTCTPNSTSLCSSTATTTITVNPVPNPALTSATVCAGTTASLTATGGSSYTLNPGNQTSGSATAVFAVTGAGTYTLTARNAIGCTATTTATVTAKPLPIASASSTTITCVAPATVTGGSSLSGTTYAWSGPSGFSSNAQTFTTNTPGTYTLVVAADGCTGAPATTTVVQNQTAPQNVLATQTGPLTCTNTTATVSVTASTTGLTYRWTGPASFTSNAQSFTTLTTGLYAVTVTSAANGCTATSSASLGQNLTTPQALSLSSSSPISCTAATVTLTASSSTTGLSYVFSGLGLVSSAGASATANQPGIYRVVATAPNGCTAMVSTLVSQTLTSVSLVQGNCVSNNTRPLSTDDYYLISVVAKPGASGASGRYEVVLSGTVLNAGGTLYGQAVTVGGAGTFRADGSTTYTLTIRDKDIPACQATAVTERMVSCSGCLLVPCVSIKAVKR